MARWSSKPLTGEQAALLSLAQDLRGQDEAPSEAAYRRVLARHRGKGADADVVIAMLHYGLIRGDNGEWWRTERDNLERSVSGFGE